MLDRLRVQEPVHGQARGDASADQDREHDCVAGPSLGSRASQQERGGEWNGGQRVAEVVDQVGEQGDARGGHVDRCLETGRCQQYREALPDRPDAGPRSLDRGVDRAMAMAVAGGVNVAHWGWARSGAGATTRARCDR